MPKDLEVDPIDLRMSSDHMDMHQSELGAAHTAANGEIEAAQAGWVGASGTIDGGYGDGNSADGKLQETAALDEHQRITNTPIIRQQVMATHPGVSNKDGSLQRRFYDGLQPTGNPGEYIGIEAKSTGAGRNSYQATFDKEVSRQTPATAILNGHLITIVGTEVVHPPAQAGPRLGPPGTGLASAEGTGVAQGNNTGLIPDSVLHWKPDLGTSATPEQLDDLYPGASQYLPQQRPPTA